MVRERLDLPDSFFEFASRPGCTALNGPNRAETVAVQRAVVHSLARLVGLHLVTLDEAGEVPPAGPGSLVVQRIHGLDFQDWGQAILCAARSGCDVLGCVGCLRLRDLHFALTACEHVSQLILATPWQSIAEVRQNLLTPPRMIHRAPARRLLARGFRVVQRAGNRLEGLELGLRDCYKDHFRSPDLQPQHGWEILP